jgi:hypothetical protein
MPIFFGAEPPAAPKKQLQGTCPNKQSGNYIAERTRTIQGRPTGPLFNQMFWSPVNTCCSDPTDGTTQAMRYWQLQATITSI